MINYFLPTIATLFIGINIQPVFAYFEKNNSKINSAEMNGIQFESHKNFPTQWKLVTVRYRVDSKELRLIYANEKAWTGLNKLKPDFEDGAIFGKVAFVAEPDPSFTSSLTPSGVKRYQLMVKDSKKYSETDGWGYALFNEEGGLFSDDLKTKTMACAACHRIVPERDFIFSRKANFNYGKNIFIEKKSEKTSSIQFSLVPFRSIPSGIKSIILNNRQDIYLIEGELKKNAFSGTLDEIIPFLIEKTKESGRASSLYLSETHFSFVEKSKETCVNKNEIKFRVIVKFNNGLVRDNEICQ